MKNAIFCLEGWFCLPWWVEGGLRFGDFLDGVTKRSKSWWTINSDQLLGVRIILIWELYRCLVQPTAIFLSPTFLRIWSLKSDAFSKGRCWVVKKSTRTWFVLTVKKSSEASVDSRGPSSTRGLSLPSTKFKYTTRILHLSSQIVLMDGHSRSVLLLPMSLRFLFCCFRKTAMTACERNVSGENWWR